MKAIVLFLIVLSFNSYSITTLESGSGFHSSWEARLPTEMTFPVSKEFSSVSCSLNQCTYAGIREETPFVKPVLSTSHSQHGASYLVYKPEVEWNISQKTHSLMTGEPLQQTMIYNSSTPVLIKPVLVFKSHSQIMMLMDSPSYHWLSVTADTAGPEFPESSNLYLLEEEEALQLTLKSDSGSGSTIEIQVYADISGVIHVLSPEQEPMDSGNGKGAKASWEDSESDDESGWAEVKDRRKPGGKPKKLLSSGDDGRRPPERPAYKKPEPLPAIPVIDIDAMSVKELKKELLKTPRNQDERIKAITLAAIQKCETERRKGRQNIRYGMKDLGDILTFHTKNQLHVITGVDWERFKRLVNNPGT